MTFESLRNFISAAGGRRFLMTLGSCFVNTLLLWFAKLSPSDYVTLTLAMPAVYIGSSTYQKVKGVQQPDS